MSHELIDHYARASAWTQDIISTAAATPEAPTPCEGWEVRRLLNHLRDSQRYFVSGGKGEDAAPPSAEPPGIFDDSSPEEVVAAFEEGRDETLRVFGSEGVIEKTGPLLGIAFTEQLLHGWDLAKATGQDSTMPDGLAEVAYRTIHGKFTDDQRTGVFKPELPAPPDAAPQDRLLTYTGRDPSA